MNRKSSRAKSGKTVGRADPRTARRVPAQRRKRRRRRQSSLLPALLFTLGVLAVIVVAVRLLPKPAANVPAATEVQTRAQGEAKTADIQAAETAPVITLAPQLTPEPTPEPTAEPTPEPTPEPTAEPAPEITPEPAPYEYLPVVHRANIESKKIAVTVDDCYQLKNLTRIVDAAEAVGGKLTLFPVGEALSKDGMPKLMQRCAFDLGFEIENHTYSHSRIFRMADDEMAAEIWKQDAALNRALGVDYQEHFLRLMGGDGDTDPRIHSYLKKLGYLGIANWSVSGSDSDMKHIRASLAPGQVYLFHCTDPDTKKLEEFIPWAVSKGYKLVTLNELFNLPGNETSALTDSAMPQPDYNVDDHHTLVEGEYTWVALQLQEKLRAMGYLKMDGPSTGYYGPQTAKAIAAFQQDHGLPATGEADIETQQRVLEG